MPEDILTVGDYAGHDLEVMAQAPRYTRWIVESFLPFVGRRVAEVGAGTGNVSQTLLTLSPVIGRLTLIEPSPAMFGRLQKRFDGVEGVTCLQGVFTDVADQLAPQDTIVYVNVLEHVEDDEGELRRAFSRLEPGGHLILFVPALQLLYSRFDRSIGHFRRYGRGGLVDLLTRCGFDPVMVRPFDLFGIVPWYLLFVLGGRTALPSSVSLYDRFVVPVMKRVEQIIPPPVGKNLLAVGKKP